jgi:hypothetical protein
LAVYLGALVLVDHGDGYRRRTGEAGDSLGVVGRDHDGAVVFVVAYAFQGLVTVSGPLPLDGARRRGVWGGDPLDDPASEVDLLPAELSALVFVYQRDR